MNFSENLKTLLHADPTDWLLEESDPGVRYLALRDLTDAGEAELAPAREAAYSKGPIGKILEHMEPDGWWVMPGFGYSPKFTSGVWSLISLSQLGASVEDTRIQAACDYFLKNSLCEGGQVAPPDRPISTAHCVQGNMLTALMDLGCRDERLNTAYEWMAKTVTGDGLPKKLNSDGFGPGEGIEGPYWRLNRFDGPAFACRTNEYLACSWGGVSVMSAFARLPEERKNGDIRKAIETGTSFFLDAEPEKAGFGGHRAGTPDPLWWQFKFPDFYPADILKLAETFTALGFGNDPRLKNTVQCILNKQDDQGRWKLDVIDKNRKMWVKYGAPGESNKWITLRVLRLLKRIAEAA